MLLCIVDAAGNHIATFFNGRAAQICKRVLEADYKSVFEFPLQLLPLEEFMKKKKKKQHDTPLLDQNKKKDGPWTQAYRRIIDEAKALDPQAANLARLCEDSGLTPEGALSLGEETLDRYDLCLEDITPGVIHRAAGVMRELSSTIQLMVKARNANFGVNPPDFFEEKKQGHKESSNGDGKKRTKLFGHPVTAVIRWMGAEGDWDKKKAKQALDKLGCDVADATINAQLRAGAKGERGDPAKLREDEANELYEALE